MSLTSQRSWTNRRLDTCNPVLKEKYTKLVGLVWLQLGVLMTVVQGARSTKKQIALYAIGRTVKGKKVTKARPMGKKVTWTLTSLHVVGKKRTKADALDFAFLTDEGVPSWMGPWKKVGLLAESLGLRWGGRFTDSRGRPVGDYGHLELRSNA